MTLYFLRNDKVLLQPTKLWKDFLKDVLEILKQDKIVYKNEDVHYRLQSKNPETLEIQESYKILRSPAFNFIPTKILKVRKNRADILIKLLGDKQKENLTEEISTTFEGKVIKQLEIVLQSSFIQNINFHVITDVESFKIDRNLIMKVNIFYLVKTNTFYVLDVFNYCFIQDISAQLQIPALLKNIQDQVVHFQFRNVLPSINNVHYIVSYAEDPFKFFAQRLYLCFTDFQNTFDGDLYKRLDFYFKKECDTNIFPYALDDENSNNLNTNKMTENVGIAKSLNVSLDSLSSLYSTNSSLQEYLRQPKHDESEFSPMLDFGSPCLSVL